MPSFLAEWRAKGYTANPKLVGLDGAHPAYAMALKPEVVVWPRNAATEGLVRALCESWLTGKEACSVSVHCGPLKQQSFIGSVEYMS